MMGLTPAMAESLDFLQTYIRDHNGVAPNFDEMEEGFGVCRSRVHVVLSALEERGLIRRIPNRARAIEIMSTVVPDKSKAEIANEICRLAWEWSGRTRYTDDLFPLVLGALR